MTLQPSKKTSKKFTFKDDFCEIIFVGNGKALTGSEMQALVEKYHEKAMKRPIGEPLIVDFDLERTS